MKQRVCIIAFVLLVMFCIIVFPCVLVAEEAVSVAGENAAEEASIEAPAVSEAAMPQEPLQTQWILGKVVLLDVANNSLTVHYVDYDTNSEQDLVFVVDQNTVYENAQSLAGLRPNDTVSIDYRIIDGKNIARVVGIERVEEESAPLSLPRDE
ncbi:MAG: hypothetical protein PHG31_00130 [Candidatus Omnitrophica bacterium]|nr:hypothetical protein [Candidatus Omnitrophota bacterium]